MMQALLILLALTATIECYALCAREEPKAARWHKALNDCMVHANGGNKTVPMDEAAIRACMDAAEREVHCAEAKP